MSLHWTARVALCAATLALGCDNSHLPEDAGSRDSGLPRIDAGGEDDAGRRDAGPGTDSGPSDSGPEDAGVESDAGTGEDDAGASDGGGVILIDGGPRDAGPAPDAGCEPRLCRADECGVGLSDDGCGNPLICPTCGIGGGCLDDAGCRAAMICLTEEDSAWSRGYCSRECRLDTECVGASHCGFHDALTRIGLCVANCTTDADCRSGYACRNADGAGASECVGTGSGPGAVGTACTVTSDCAGAERGFCVREGAGWRAGYCSMTCSLADACPSGSHCGFYDATSGAGVCLANCASDAECRADGYQCYNGDADGPGLNECFPAATGTGAPGDACTGAWDCSGDQTGNCLLESADARGGYCYRAGCTGDGECPAGSHCGTFTTSATTSIGLCTANCVSDVDCRADGYQCYDVNGDARPECWRAGTGTAAVGARCTGIWECAGGRRAVCAERPGNDFEGGYCLLTGCTTGGTGTASCPIGSHCSIFGTSTTGLCTDDCGLGDACRSVGYACYDTADVDFATECWPSATGGGLPGEPCRWRADCAGGENGFCLLEGDPATTGDELPGGYCTQTCATGVCPPGSMCIGGACYRTCASDSNCRVTDGYSCRTLGDGSRICYQ